MARAWTEVIADPNFQALSPDAKEAARNAYFQQNVLPNIPQDANASAIRLKFDQATVPTVRTAPPTTYDAAEFKRRVGRDPEPTELANFKAFKGVGFAGDPTQGKFTAGQAAVGALEDATALGTGIAAGVPAAATYLGSGGNLEAAKKVQGGLTYAPRSDAGQAGLQGVGDVVKGPGKVAQFAADKIDPTGNLSATLGDVGERAMMASGIIPGVAALRGGLAARVPGAIRGAADAVVNSVRDPEAVAGTAQDVVNQAAARAPQNMGAAAAAPGVQGASPELQQAIVQTARSTGNAVNPEVLQRHLQADSLPVKVQLTEGQATQDPALLSEEQNLRGQRKPYAERFNQQNQQLIDNVQAIRDQVGPDVFSTNQVEHGDTLIDAYKAKDAAAKADIKSKYQALKDANGGVFPVDGQAFVTAADQALAQEMKARYVPSEIKADLADFRDGKPMTFTHFENMRTNLAAEGRKAGRSGDGNAEGAINIVRNALESLPMTGESAQIKPLADAARAAAKARFDALGADPAYKAAVNETVPADKFVGKFVLGGNRDDVATMTQNLAGNDSALQTLSVAALDHLRDAAVSSGNFSQARFNKALQGLSPKLQSLVDPKTAEQLDTLGNVARYTQAQPRGSFVNNSNTFVAGAADYGAGAVEHAANAVFHGVPVATAIRKGANALQASSRERQALSPGAGLGRLAATSPRVEAMLEAARRKAAAAQQVNP